MKFYEYISEKADKWITINGRHVQIDSKGFIKKGLDDALIGKHLDDVKDHFENEKKKSSEKKESGVKESDKNKKHLKEVTKEYYNEYKEKIKSAQKKSKAHEASKVDFDSLEKKVKNVKQHCREYCSGGYRAINGLLRGTMSAKELKEEGLTKAEVKKWTKTLEDAFEHTRTKEDMVLYRGFANNISVGLNPGDIIEDKGFVSTSSEEKRAVGFGRTRDSTILQIYVPKGSKAMSVKELSGFAAEEEILLNKNSKFRILKKVGDKLHVELVED